MHVWPSLHSQYVSWRATQLRGLSFSHRHFCPQDRRRRMEHSRETRQAASYMTATSQQTIPAAAVHSFTSICFKIHASNISWQEAQLSPRDSAMRRVSWNLANCHTTVQKLLVRKVLNKSKLLQGYSGTMCNKHVHSTMTRSSRFCCPVGVINKLTKVELWISPVYRRFAVAKFSKCTMYKLLTWPWPCTLREHSLTTRPRLRMADLCTKFEVSSISHCGEITWDIKF